MEGRVEITAPTLLYYEVANILLFGRSRPPAAEALSDLFSIPLMVAAPAPDAADVALQVAIWPFLLRRVLRLRWWKCWTAF